MATETATAIAYVGAFVGLIGGGVALFNSWKAVSWKRAELANNYLRDFHSDSELVFACRCLDWNGGLLVVPESLQPLLGSDEKCIRHEREVFARALKPELLVSELDVDPRIQIYRTSLDALLAWLSLVASALERKLFQARDIAEVGYWLTKLEKDLATHNFICAYGYQNHINNLIHAYASMRSDAVEFDDPIKRIDPESAALRTSGADQPAPTPLTAI
jgi:hypothetical protein